MKIEVLPRAEDDILRQFRYYLVEQNAPRTAVRFRQGVRESLNQLQKHPRIGSLLPGSVPGLRCWPVKGFDAIRIYYIEFSGNLRVVRILHGKRNVRRILKEES